MNARLHLPSALAGAVLTLGLFLNGCATESIGECAENTDCPTGFTCDGAKCKCAAEDACGPGQFCNDFGTCQARPPCIGNEDCDPGQICNSADPTGGRCIADTACGSSVHCDLGNYCHVDPAAEQPVGDCRPGCRNTGDCALGDICVAGGCQAGMCNQCPVNPDPDATYCPYGYKCGLSGACELVTNGGSLCNRCDNMFDPCPDGQRCLIDNESCSCIDNKCYPTDTPCTTAADCGSCEAVNYCAPTCNFDADCPSGYDTCGSVILVCGSCSTASPSCALGGVACVLTTTRATRAFAPATS